MKPTNCKTMISGPGVVSASARPSTACDVRQPAVGADRGLRHVGEHGVGPAESDERGLREEEVLLRMQAAPAAPRHQRRERQSPERDPHQNRSHSAPRDGSVCAGGGAWSSMTSGA